MARREIQVFNMSFLDMMTNFLGAVIILFLLSAQNISKAPAGSGLIRKVEGSYDPDRLILHGQTTNVKIGDTLMLIVKDNQPVIPSGLSDGNYAHRNPPKQRPYVDTTGIWRTKPPYNQQPEALFIESAIASDCNDAGTPDAADDTYTVSITIAKSGKTASTACNIDGRKVDYGKSTELGPFLIRNGAKTFVVRDGQNANLTKTMTINPPPPCSASDAPPQPPINTPPVAGVVNFYAKWDDPNDKVNIYVRKGNRWVFGLKKSDEQIGVWSELAANAGPFNRENTNVETVRQNSGFIPGTYQIYLHYKGTKGAKTPKTAVPVSLWLINAKYPGDTKQFGFKIPYTEKSPKSMGAKALVTVEITADGHFIIR